MRPNSPLKANGPLGIRTSVWLILFGAVLVCVLTIALSRRHTSLVTRDAASENVAHQESSTRRASFRRTSHIEFTPTAYESGSSSDLDEVQLAMIEQMTQDRRTWMDNPD
jgi:hypothetical protein